MHKQHYNNHILLLVNNNINSEQQRWGTNHIRPFCNQRLRDDSPTPTRFLSTILNDNAYVTNSKTGTVAAMEGQVRNIYLTWNAYVMCINKNMTDTI